MRIGVLGGTFDPIHFGHLAIAEEARWALALDQVLVVPAARQPLKTGGAHATPLQRLDMARYACADNPAFHVSDIEIRRPPPSYTVDTLRQLHAELGPQAELCFILGADALAELPRWHEIMAILALARIVAVERPGRVVDRASLAASLPELPARLTILPGPALEISSSELRQRVAAGQPIRYLVPEPVRRYIASTGLYRS